MSDPVDAPSPGAATSQAGEDNPAPGSPSGGNELPGGSDTPPPGGNDTAPAPGALPQRPRRLRSLVIGLIIAALLAVLLFVVLRPPSSSNGSNLGVNVGDPAPDFTLPRLGGGKPVNLDAIGVDRHKPVILNFFASWCGPCQAETPMLAQAAAAAKAAGSPVQFVGVDVNDPSSNALAFVHQTGVTYPVGADLTLKVTSVDYALNAQPNTFFIDGSGKIIGQHQGALTKAELAQWMKRLTGGGS
jgi:cytochrome c biogenesis protein CcmG/thiol:disulfide interchange protein DsbE